MLLDRAHSLPGRCLRAPSLPIRECPRKGARRCNTDRVSTLASARLAPALPSEPDTALRWGVRPLCAHRRHACPACRVGERGPVHEAISCCTPSAPPRGGEGRGRGRAGSGPAGARRRDDLARRWIDACAVSNHAFAKFATATGHVTEAERSGWSGGGRSADGHRDGRRNVLRRLGGDRPPVVSQAPDELATSAVGPRRHATVERPSRGASLGSHHHRNRQRNRNAV
jgi:hypothetical protein